PSGHKVRRNLNTPFRFSARTEIALLLLGAYAIGKPHAIEPDGGKKMKNIKLTWIYKVLIAVVTISITCTLPLASGATALGGSQSSVGGIIDPGTTVHVRTNEEINATDTDGRVFSGVVDQDVMGRNGRIVIPKGSDVELAVKRASDKDLALDLDSVTINGQRYGVEAEQNVITPESKEGIGANKRTGKYVGGG